MSQESNSSPNKNATKTSSNIANSAAAKGYVATQNSLNGLLNDLLGTVKGIRKQQKEQQEKIEQLTKQVQTQKEELERLKLYQKHGKGPPATTVVASSSSSNVPASSNSNNNDLAQFRRELVGIIGEALAQHEEEHHDEENMAAVAPPTATFGTENTDTPPTESSSEDTIPVNWQNEWNEFRSTILPRYLTRTFHSNGATVLKADTSFMDYPMAMIPPQLTPATSPPELTTYSWSLQAVGNRWAVGVATLASITKWQSATDKKKVLGDAKGEWAYRSDSTLWSHDKQRQALNNNNSLTSTTCLLTLTLEFHPNERILLKGSINNQQPQPQPQSQSTAAAASASAAEAVVWFDIPWKNFKKPTSFVPAVTCQKDSVVRFRGWNI